MTARMKSFAKVLFKKILNIGNLFSYSIYNIHDYI